MENQRGAPGYNGEQSNGRGGGGHGGRCGKLNGDDAEQERFLLGEPCGGGQSGRGGKHNGDDAEQERLFVGPAGEDDESTGGGGDPAGELQETPHPRDGKEANAGDRGARGGHRGSQSGDADQESRHLGGPGGQPRHRADEQAAGLPRGGARGGEDMLFARSGAPTHPDGEGDGDGKVGTADGGGNGESDGAGMTVTTRRLTTRPVLLLPESTFLSKALLSWTLKDLLNEDLYKNEVQKLPDTFDSAGQFIDLYSRLLKEETRATISSAVQSRSQTTMEYCQLKSVKPGDSSLSSAFYLDVDLALTRSDDIQCHHIAEDYDICLLSSRSPLDPNLDIMSCHIGMVVGVGRDIFFQRSFMVLVSDFEEFVPKKIKFACFLTNIKHSMQTANILSSSDERNINAVRAVMELYREVGKKCNTYPTILHWKDSMTLGNKKSMVPDIRDFLQSPAEIIWAPPGTLKIHFASVLKDLFLLRVKVLVCLPSASTLPDILVDLTEQCVSDGVLVLSNRRQEGTERYENFLLGNQSQELFSYLAQRKSLESMSSLLDLSRYSHISCMSDGSCAHCSKSGLLPFSVNSFKQKFAVIWSQLLGCLVYVKNHCEIFSLTEQDAASIEDLINTLETFKTLLHDNNLKDDIVATAFGLVLCADLNSADMACTIANSLNETRISCITLISNIKSSIQLLPEFKTRDDIDRFCIESSKIILTTLDETSLLDGVKMKLFDILFVYGASQIRSDQLLVSFLHPVKQTVLFGDQYHLHPVVRSKMCEEAGYNVSIFERLQHLVPEKKMLKMQFAMHPSISQFPNTYFYEGIVEDGPNVTSAEYNKFITGTLPPYGFMDIFATELGKTRKRYVSSAAIFLLVQELCNGMNPTGKVHICVVCLSSNDSNTIRNQLTFKKEIHDRIHLEVKCIDNLQHESFDVIILPLLVEDDSELKHVKEGNLYAALTSARHCLWMVGEQDSLVCSGGIWRSLISDAKKRFCIQKMNENKLIEIVKQLELNEKGHSSDCNPALSRKITHMPGQEFTWAERPYMTRKILAPVRNQQGQADTCSFQSISGAVESLFKIQNAGLIPPQEFNWKFLLDDWKSQYAATAPKPFGLESRTDRGEKRLETSFGLYKSNGVMASDESGSKMINKRMEAICGQGGAQNDRK